MTKQDVVALVFMVAGLLGALGRAWITSDQTFVSKRTFNDAIVGLLGGILWQAYPPIDFPEQTTLLMRAAIVFGTTYFVGDVVQSIVTRVTAMVKKP